MATDVQLQALGQDIWVVDGPNIDFYSIPFTTRMTVIRLKNGDLFLHSPVRYSAELAKQLAELGPVRHLVSPNWIHYAWIQGWADAVPDTIAWASPNVRERAAKRGVRVEFDHDLAGDADDAWSDEISQMIVHGSRAHVEVVFFHHPSRTLVLTDLIENMDRDNLRFWQRPLARLGGVLAPNGKMPLDIWMSFSKHRDQLATALGQMLDWDPNVVVIAHGDFFREDAQQRLREGFRGLAPMGRA